MFVSELEKKKKKFYFYFYFFNVIIFNCAHLENFFWLRHYHHLVTSTSSSKPQFGPFLTLSFKKKKKKKNTLCVDCLNFNTPYGFFRITVWYRIYVLSHVTPVSVTHFLCAHRPAALHMPPMAFETYSHCVSSIPKMCFKWSSPLHTSLYHMMAWLHSASHRNSLLPYAFTSLNVGDALKCHSFLCVARIFHDFPNHPTTSNNIPATIQTSLVIFQPHLMVLTLFNGPLKNFLPNFSCHQTSILNKGVLEN